ncbi:unnamed protein product [Heterobilharzia americana]|nr:unnamed protein product [Heterobilharzia americana]
MHGHSLPSQLLLRKFIIMNGLFLILYLLIIVSSNAEGKCKEEGALCRKTLDTRCCGELYCHLFKPFHGRCTNPNRRHSTNW